MELFSTRLALRPWVDADAPALFELARDPRVGTAVSTRLALRPWVDADAPALFELARDPRVGTAAGWPPHSSEEQSLDILRNVLRGPEQYAITLRESGRAKNRASTSFVTSCEGPSNTPSLCAKAASSSVQSVF